ncbi:MAG: putative 2-dehydropantoate 2-reductase [Sinobacterium sp.]
MKYAVIGTGAIGGYYGGLLARNGMNVHFLLHSDHQHVKKQGLRIDSINGNFTIDVNAYAKPEDMPLCDVAIIALKTTNNHLLKVLLPQVVKHTGIVVIMQNGLAVEQVAADILPQATIIGGLCFIGSTKIGPGHIKHSDFGMVSLGHYMKDESAAGITPELELVTENFLACGIDVKPVENLSFLRWQKLVWNVPFNGLSVVLNSGTAELLRQHDSRALIKSIMLEVITAANACGQPLSASVAELMLVNTETNMQNYSPSMKVDYEHNRPLEIDAIYQSMIDRAALSGVEMNLARMLAQQLRFLKN